MLVTFGRIRRSDEMESCVSAEVSAGRDIQQDYTQITLEKAVSRWTYTTVATCFPTGVNFAFLYG